MFLLFVEMGKNANADKINKINIVNRKKTIIIHVDHSQHIRLSISIDLSIQLVHFNRFYGILLIIDFID